MGPHRLPPRLLVGVAVLVAPPARDPQTNPTRKVLMRRRKLLAATILAVTLGATVATPPTAQADTEAAAAGSFYAGNIWQHYDRGGNSKGIFFDNVGWCDSTGYVLNLQSIGSGWHMSISSFAFSGNNGCNAAKVYAKSGLVYTYLLPGVTYNGPAYPGWSDSAKSIRFYHFGG